MRNLNQLAVGVGLATTLIVSIYLIPQVTASQAGKEMRMADDRLNQVYQTLISKIKTPAQKRQLIAAQRAWIALRDADGNFFGDYYTNSKGGLFYKTKLTKDRADYLQAIIDRPPTNNGDDFGPEKYTD
jgi:predicted small secreted protein